MYSPFHNLDNLLVIYTQQQMIQTIRISHDKIYLLFLNNLYLFNSFFSSYIFKAKYYINKIISNKKMFLFIVICSIICFLSYQNEQNLQHDKII
jgi:hypothetical protein